MRKAEILVLRQGKGEPIRIIYPQRARRAKRYEKRASLRLYRFYVPILAAAAFIWLGYYSQHYKLEPLPVAGRHSTAPQTSKGAKSSLARSNAVKLLDVFTADADNDVAQPVILWVQQ